MPSAKKGSIYSFPSMQISQNQRLLSYSTSISMSHPNSLKGSVTFGCAQNRQNSLPYSVSQFFQRFKILRQIIPIICSISIHFLSSVSANRPLAAAWQSIYHGNGDIASLWPLQDEGNVDDNQIQPGDADDAPRRLMRNALRPTAKNRWTHYRDERRQFIIPYRIDGHFLPLDERRIMEAMASVAKNSCIRFRPWHGEADHLVIRNELGQGCYSTTVGRLPGALNVINLETNESVQCASQLGLILHELFHVVGLWHEHQRMDRHRYIRIHRRLALPGTRLQLMKVPRDQATRYGVHYDYRSVMHYPKDGFAIFPNQIVLETRRPFFQDIIGHAKDASPNDYLKVCAIYDCRRCMGRNFRRGRNTRARGIFYVQSIGEEEIRQQFEENGRGKQWPVDEEGDEAEEGFGKDQQQECRCTWDGCKCLMANGQWQWRPFGP